MDGVAAADVVVADLRQSNCGRHRFKIADDNADALSACLWCSLMSMALFSFLDALTEHRSRIPTKMDLNLKVLCAWFATRGLAENLSTHIALNIILSERYHPAISLRVMCRESRTASWIDFGKANLTTTYLQPE